MDHNRAFSSSAITRRMQGPVFPRLFFTLRRKAAIPLHPEGAEGEAGRNTLDTCLCKLSMLKHQSGVEREHAREGV